jgi:hypothetical protein
LEFDRRNAQYNLPTNDLGEFYLTKGNLVYLKDNRLFLAREYLQVTVGGVVVKGEIIKKTHLSMFVRIVEPFVFWENYTGLPNQALGGSYYFWGAEGNRCTRELGQKLLIESYRNVKIIDKNLDIFVGIYDTLQKELKEIDKLDESEITKKIKRSLWNGFECTLSNTYGLRIGNGDKQQLEEIILAYKTDKRKIYVKGESNLRNNWVQLFFNYLFKQTRLS